MLKNIVLSLALLAGVAEAQPYALYPSFPQQFYNNTGQPLAAGFVITCGAGLTCAYPVPGNPLPSFTDSSASTTNANPVPLNAFGFPASGGIWLNTQLAYKLVLVDSTGAIVKTIDNIQPSGGGGGGSTNYWTLSGSTISNNNGAGAGNVQTGADLIVGGSLNLSGALQLKSNTGFTANISAGTGMGSNVSWRWAKIDAAGCLESDGSGNLSFTTCGGGGGGGSPGGPINSIQSNNPSGTFYGDANFIYTPGSSPPLVAVTGIFQAGGTTGGFNAPAATAINSIQAPVGGVTAKWLVATDSNFLIEEAAPAVSAAGQARIYADSTEHSVKLSPNNKAYRPIGLTDAWSTLMNGDCVSITVTSGVPFFADAGGPCTTGGGGGTVSSSAQFNVGYYTSAGTGTTIGGNGALAFCPTCGAGSTAQVTLTSGNFLTVGTNFGFDASTCTATNCVQAPNGGVSGKYLVATDSVFFIEGAVPITLSPASQARIVADSVSHTLKVSQNASPFFTLATTTGVLTNGNCVSINAGGQFVDNGSPCGGGGSGSPGGPSTSVQFNNTGAFLGSANLTWNNTTHLLIATTTGATAGMAVATGYMQADGGFLGTSGVCTAYNCFNAPTGGMAAKSLLAVNYIQAGNSNGSPPLSVGDAFHAGAMYYDTGLAAMRVFNGSSFVNLGVGGVASVNTLTGALTINNAGQTNAITVSPSGTTISLTLPQAIGTGSAVTFGSVAASGAFNSAVTGATNGIIVNSGNFLVNGNGAVSAAGVVTSASGVNVITSTATNSIQTSGGVNVGDTGSGNGVYQVNSSTIINSVGQFVGAAVLATGNVQAGGVFAVAGGFFGDSGTFTVSGTCTLFVRGGIIYGHAGC